MKLDKPLVVFDLETTGLNTLKDRIVQIGAIKVHPDGKREEKDVIINPTVPIPKMVSQIHGIHDQDVIGKPTFRQISKSLLGWLSGCDLAGYNSNRFDVPILVEEFTRSGIFFPKKNRNFIDVLKIEQIVNKRRTLSATYKHYTGKDLDGAHNALIDVRATLLILEKQLEQNQSLPSVSMLDSFCQKGQERVDFSGKLYKKEGQIYWRFGKHQDQLVLETEEYARWVLSADFSADTKWCVWHLLEEDKK